MRRGLVHMAAPADVPLLQGDGAAEGVLCAVAGWDWVWGAVLGVVGQVGRFGVARRPQRLLPP
jgi:hypothetical protein